VRKPRPRRSSRAMATFSIWICQYIYPRGLVFSNRSAAMLLMILDLMMRFVVKKEPLSRIKLEGSHLSGTLLSLMLLMPWKKCRMVQQKGGL
jgi:membrane protein CcdC involved in cytochrome C biogenesis